MTAAAAGGAAEAGRDGRPVLLVLRALGLGDFLTVVPALRALSDAFPGYRRVLAGAGALQPLALEMAGRVGVTLLIPGGMRTAFFDGRDPQYQPGPDAQLNSPEHVAAAVVFALRQPPGCELRELVITPSRESSWP